MSKLMVLGGSMAGVGGIGACGYAAYSMIQPSNVKESLIKNNFKLTSELIEREQSNAWSKVTETYKVEATDDTKIGEKDISSITSKDIEDWCKESIKVGVKDKNYESTYSKASRWCVVYTSIEEKLKSENKTIQTDTSSLATKYNSMPNDLKTSILGGSTSGQEGQKTKEWCDKNSKRTFLGIGDSHYQNLVSYCLKG